MLYYSVSSFGKNTSAIGLATNPTLNLNDPEYRWKDEGIVVRSSATDNFNSIDPSVIQDEQGRLWLAFGSFWSGVKLIELNRATGKPSASNSPIYSLAQKESIEGACLYRRANYYYLFVNWGRCCRGVQSTYNIRVGRSKEIVGPYRDIEGVELIKGGGSLVLGTRGTFIGPGHAGIIRVGDNEWFSCHFYDGSHSGTPTLSILRLHWSGDGWPEVELPHR
jgi:arabinan endo-1,5-alpha-L-arabinosidase